MPSYQDWLRILRIIELRFRIACRLRISNFRPKALKKYREYPFKNDNFFQQLGTQLWPQIWLFRLPGSHVSLCQMSWNSHNIVHISIVTRNKFLAVPSLSFMDRCALCLFCTSYPIGALPLTLTARLLKARLIFKTQLVPQKPPTSFDSISYELKPHCQDGSSPFYGFYTASISKKRVPFALWKPRTQQAPICRLMLFLLQNLCTTSTNHSSCFQMPDDSEL